MENPFAVISERLLNIESLLLDIKHGELKQDIQPAPILWFNPDGLCDYLTDKPSKATVYGWVHTGRVPYYKTGKKLRFLKSEIDLWLQSGKRKTTVEIAAEAASYVKSKGGK